MLWVLAACSAPTTSNPNVTQDELLREQAAQSQAAAEAEKLRNFHPKKTYSAAQVAEFSDRLSPLALRVSRAAGALCQELHPERDCRYSVVLDPKEKGLNAHADGARVVINPAMVDFARNDNQLAFVIAHEFAHNLMGHIAAKEKNTMLGAILGVVADAGVTAAGMNSGGSFSELGARQGALSYSPAFEAEADYVGLYILARAGFTIEEAPGLWRLMSIAQPKSIYISTTHPNNPTRTIAMEKTITEIRAKQRAGLPLLPNFKAREDAAAAASPDVARTALSTPSFISGGIHG